MRATRADAYRLFHRGARALTRAEINGIRVDTDVLEAQITQCEKEMADLVGQLSADPVWRVWKKAHPNAKLGSRKELADVFFRRLGYLSLEKTETGLDATDADAFAHIVDQPFLARYFRWQKLYKLRHTYLEGLRRETCDGVLRPSFNLTTVISYRSSSSGPNFQNIPVRDRDIMERIRCCFVPRRGYCIVEVDLSGAEVRVAYCYHKDRTMRAYLLDPNSDMHGDTAEELFCLPKGWIRSSPENRAWAKKAIRDWTKSDFVFAQFYGSVYFQSAARLWQHAAALGPEGQYKHKMPDGRSVVAYLESKGIRSLGACDPKRPPEPGTFEYRVKQIERSFWEERFPEYSQWRKDWVQAYYRNGYIENFTGFRWEGLYSRNQLINLPVQSSAFHLLLEGFCDIQDYIDRYDMRSRLIGQIHDSVVAECPEDEVQDYLTAAHHILTITVPKRWPWVTIPIDIEAEVCGVDESWNKKKVWKKGDDGLWAAA